MYIFLVVDIVSIRSGTGGVSKQDTSIKIFFLKMKYLFAQVVVYPLACLKRAITPRKREEHLKLIFSFKFSFCLFLY